MHVLYSFPHTLGRPGIATTALQQVRGLAAAGVEVTVACSFSEVTLPVHTVVQTLGVGGRRIPHRAFAGVQRAYDYHDWRVARLLRARPGDFDLVHAWPRACLNTVRAATEHGIPAVREVPSPHTESAFIEARFAAGQFGLDLPSTHSHAWNDAVLAREVAEYEAATFLAVPSDYAAETFIARGFAPERLLRTQYGFDPDAMCADQASPPVGGPLRAVFAGRGEPNKGLHLALRAWIASGAGEVGGSLRICGALWPPYTDQLRTELGAPGVQVEGFVANLPQILTEADVLLLPTFTEGAALVTYEAIGAGCVPLVSSAAGAPVTHGVNGLIHSPGDVSTLTEHLSSLLDPANLERLRLGCLEHRDALTWAAAGRRLAAAYRQAISLKSHSS